MLNSHYKKDQKRRKDFQSDEATRRVKRNRKHEMEYAEALATLKRVRSKLIIDDQDL